MVDNCYGEFVERIEPSDVGADMIVGSLIKNPGGGLAPIGGYVAGKKDLSKTVPYRLTIPRIRERSGSVSRSDAVFLSRFFYGADSCMRSA